MTSYPICYTFLVLPLSVARRSTFAGKSKPVASGVTFFTITIFHLTGFMNVILFLYLRGSVTLLDPGSAEDDDEEEGNRSAIHLEERPRREDPNAVVEPMHHVDGGGLPD